MRCIMPRSRKAEHDGYGEFAAVCGRKTDAFSLFSIAAGDVR
ncbi:hypothetical protein HMPREF3038_02092 [Akkermansia sp. KLE1797]|nr:hypothetical protein HMPREF3038_02092 [Akkermansia sp. KLE1797]KZA05771.1 hypothetical protein HMPREF1326_00598 [Akkermansia sp. KLE1605]